MNDISFRREFGLWWPNEETTEKLYEYMLDRVTDVDVAIKFCRTRGVCVQAGGFIGMWPRRLAKFFEYVHTFEPRLAHFECVQRNTKFLPGVIARNYVLGPVHDVDVEITPKRGGCTRVVKGGKVTARQVTIDSLQLSRCDAIFLDVERYEIPVLEGAAKTLKRFHPVLMLEQKQDTRQLLIDWTKQYGYEFVAQVHADMVFARRGK